MTARGSQRAAYWGVVGKQILVIVSLLACAAGAQQRAAELRYDLRPGDHVIYQQKLTRESAAGGVEAVTDWAWTSHVLVTAANADFLTIGFQRNRTRGELVSYRARGRDRTADERPAFLQRLAQRDLHFSEANQLTRQGLPRFAWRALREAPSQLLFDFQEVEELPAGMVRPGDTWTGTSLLAFAFRAVAWERVAGYDCLRVEGAAGESVKLRYWFAPQAGLMVRIELEGSYAIPPDGRTNEKLSWELAERRRGESLGDWLRQQGVRNGVLAALHVSDSLPVPAAEVFSLLDSGDDKTIQQALSLAYRARVGPAPLDRLEKLYTSTAPRLRALTVRNLQAVNTPEALALLEHAKNDLDFFVRKAADAVARARQTNAPISAEQNPREGCGNGWAERVMRGRRSPAQVPGATMRWLATPKYFGWPYVVYVPEEYRGDEPFPLLVYLSGAGGRAMAGALNAEQTIQQHGYLAVFPQANGWWWREQPTRAVATLLEEVLREFNVDPNRVYLAGMSNGGTGTLSYTSLWTDRFAAAVPMMGAGFRPPDGEPPVAANLTRLPLLFLHGRRDEVIPASVSEEAVRLIQAADRDAPVELKLFDDRGHDVYFDTTGSLTIPFLERHVRDPFPRVVQFHSRTLEYARRFWVEITEKENGLAEVRAAIGENNTIELRTRRVKRLRLLLRSELIDRGAPLRVVWNGKEVFQGDWQEDCSLLDKTWRETNDPYRAHSFVVELAAPR